MSEEGLERGCVAGGDEVLAYLTCVLRGEAGGELEKATARMKAAELLGKRMGLFEEGAHAISEPVIIVDDVGVQCASELEKEPRDCPKRANSQENMVDDAKSHKVAMSQKDVVGDAQSRSVNSKADAVSGAQSHAASKPDIPSHADVSAEA